MDGEEVEVSGTWRQIEIGWPRIGDWPLFCLVWDWQAGVVWLRIFGYGLSIKAPWWPPLFSERNGFKRPLLKIGGWRLFPLWPQKLPKH